MLCNGNQIYGVLFFITSSSCFLPWVVAPTLRVIGGWGGDSAFFGEVTIGSVFITVFGISTIWESEGIGAAVDGTVCILIVGATGFCFTWLVRAAKSWADNTIVLVVDGFVPLDLFSLDVVSAWDLEIVFKVADGSRLDSGLGTILNRFLGECVEDEATEIIFFV